jgi:hypothetical protein
MKRGTSARDFSSKRGNSRMRTGLHRPLNSTALPHSERRKQELRATALAGGAAPRTRKTEYSNATPFSGEPAKRPRERIHARLYRLSIGTGTLPRCKMRTCSPVGGQRVAGWCSAVRCSACVKGQTRAQGSKLQVRQLRWASRERGDSGSQERASYARQV